MTDILTTEVADGIARLTLNDPSTINSLSEDMLAALQSALDTLAEDTSVKAIILGSSGKHFCAGHNLKQMTARREDADGGHAYFVDLFAQCSTMMKTIVRQPQPVIAEVRGIATAAGCQLVAACDLALAADSARFATSGVNVGLFCSTPMVAVSRNLSRKHAMEMLLLGEFLPATRVAEMGLINRVVAEDELHQAGQEMALMVASKSAAAIKLGKQAYYQQLEMDLDSAYAHAGAVMAQNMMGNDAECGIGAFVNKQPMPQWTDS